MDRATDPEHPVDSVAPGRTSSSAHHKSTVGHSKEARGTILDILPIELIAEIIDICIPGLYELRHNRSIIEIQPPFYSWLKITHVCQRWRNIALQHPRIWRRIAVTSPECVHAMLARSKNAPLVLYAGDFDLPDTSQLVDMICQLLSQTHRIEGIYFWLSDQTFQAIQSRLEVLRVPRLRFLKWMVRGSATIDAIPIHLAESPLQEVCVSGVRSICSQLPSPTMASSVDIRNVPIPYDTLLDTLSCMPNLFDLTIGTDAQHPLPLDRQPVHFPKLGSFRLWGTPDLVYLLRALRLPSTCNVTVHLMMLAHDDHNLEEISATVGSLYRNERNKPFQELKISHCKTVEVGQIQILASRSGLGTLDFLLITWFPDIAFDNLDVVHSGLPLDHIRTLRIFRAHHDLGRSWWEEFWRFQHVEELWFKYESLVPFRGLLSFPSGTSVPSHQEASDSALTECESESTNTPGEATVPFRKLRKATVQLEHFDEPTIAILHSVLAYRKARGVPLDELVIVLPRDLQAKMKMDDSHEEIIRRLEEVVDRCSLV
ncbi:hypothetical protein K474DRAFT_1775323 [Panus rudis PR-1116 ss-1]|nr:hypothetical protein K474DRAFT_1775323 [Panus rudis PR-1116 ss-1]